MNESTRYELVSTGVIPGWLSLVIALVLAAIVVQVLRRELARSRDARAWVTRIAIVRVLIVGLACWLLAQPLVIVRSQWQEKPRLLLLTSDRKSMTVREEFGGTFRKMDALSELGVEDLSARNAAASLLARQLGRLGDTHAGIIKSLLTQQERIDSGLPPDHVFTKLLTANEAHLKDAREQLTSIRPQLDELQGNDELKAAKTALLSELDLIASTCNDLQTRAKTVVNEAVNHPDLFAQFITDLTAVGDKFNTLESAAEALQEQADGVLVPEATRTAVAERHLSRQDVAGETVSKVKSSLADRFEIVEASYSDLETGLRDGLGQRMQAGMDAIAVFADGTEKLTPGVRNVVRTLSSAGTAVHGVLVGADGVAPADVGIVSVDVPPVAVADKATPVRVYVKADVPEKSAVRVVIRSAERVIAEAKVIERPQQVLSIPLRLESTGRHRLSLTVTVDGDDHFPGNESWAATIDVLEAPQRAIVVGAGPSDDLAMLAAIAGAAPWLDVEVLLADSGGKLRIGKKKGQFPDSADAWENVRLLAVFGKPPKLKDKALKALSAAVDKGLRVWLATGEGDDNWAGLFQLSAGALSENVTLAPRADIWLSELMFGADATSSAAQWQNLPAAQVRSLSTAGVAVLKAGAETPVTLVRRGQGAILHCGVASLSALRAGDAAATVNRLVAGLLAIASRPLQTAPNEPALFPIQPVAEHNWEVVAGTVATVSQGGSLGEQGIQVASTPQITYSAAGKANSVPVLQLRNVGDFDLKASLAPLTELAELGDGAATDLFGLGQWSKDMTATPQIRTRVSTHSLWAGWWPLLLLLLLVSGEYLMRRQAGRVM